MAEEFIPERFRYEPRNPEIVVPRVGFHLNVEGLLRFKSEEDISRARKNVVQEGDENKLNGFDACKNMLEAVIKDPDLLLQMPYFPLSLQDAMTEESDVVNRRDRELFAKKLGLTLE